MGETKINEGQVKENIFQKRRKGLLFDYLFICLFISQIKWLKHNE